jgi:hypothetical protein
MLNKIKVLSALLLVTSIAASGSASAQSKLVAPRATASPQPAQPTNASGNPVEGWVTIRYSVRADGTPTDIRAVNHMPPTIDPAPAVATFEQWRFTPGTSDGEAIDWHNNETVIVFRAPAGVVTALPEFETEYARIADMVAAEVDAGEPDLTVYDRAAAANQQLLNEYAVTLADLGIALGQGAFIEIGRSNWNAALEPVQMATDRRVPMLSGPDLFPTLQLRMQIETQLGRKREALVSYERLARGLGRDEPDEFAAVGDALRRDVEESEFNPVSGRIDNDGSWRFDADRPYFYIQDIEGSIDTIDAECDTRRISLDFSEELDYQLPATLGRCVVFVKGDPGTTFQFIEVLEQSE